MKIELITEGDLLSKALNTIQALKKESTVKCIHLLVCDQNNFSSEDFKLLTNCEIPIFGGVFPQIIFKGHSYTKGLIIAGMEEVPKITVLKNISEHETVFEDEMDEAILDDEYRTMFVYIDAFSGRVSDFMEGLFRVYGIEINFMGGGAGSLDMVQKPCIITNEGILKDAAILVAFKFCSGVGVKHGWEKLSGPYKVTKSEGNILYMLDSKPAIDIYSEIIKTQTGQIISRENFFQNANGFPFAIKKIGAESIVRDPVILMPDNGIYCMGDVPINSFVEVMIGVPDKLISATKQALSEAMEHSDQSKEIECVYFIDCISRVIYLEEDFSKELATVSISNAPTFGALTIGEIANSGKDYLEFYNKTAVVSIIQKP